MHDSEGTSNININMFFICILPYTSHVWFCVPKTGKLGKWSVFNLMDDLSYLIWSPSKLSEKFGTAHTFALWKHLQE